jgi:DNA-binding CsgD family transcriptional regulator
MRLNQKLEIDRYISEALIVLEALPQSRELAMAYSHKSRIHLVVDQAEETIYWGKRAMDLAEQLADIETLCHALNNIGSAEMSHGQHVEGQIKLERSLRLSINHDYHHLAGRTFYNLASGLIDFYEYETCLAYVNEGLDYCAEHDLEIWRRRLSSLRAQILFQQGYWTELETLSDIEMPLLRLQVRRGSPISPEVLDLLRKTVDRTVFQEVAYPIVTLLAEIAWLRDDLIQCRLEVESMFQVACQANIPREMGELAYWMWRAGAITEPPPNTAEPYVSQISGNWREAASMWEGYGCPYEQGMALMDGDEAAQLAALEIFERLGARPIIEKLKGQMRAQCIRIPRGPRPKTRENPFGLTPREMEVITSIAQGKSNREIAEAMIVSVRTVETYVTRILNKLGFDSRVQIATWAIEKGLWPSTKDS